MKERPILFSGEMVRALLEGRKTQTRRIVKAFPQGGFIQQLTSGEFEWSPDGGFDQGVVTARCPYGQPGDSLWVKETHAFGQLSPTLNGPIYRADGGEHKGNWRPSIFMPRWASRITLAIESVRVERLQDISEEDAIAEGIGAPIGGCWFNYQKPTPLPTGRESYRSLWESINGPGSWALSPYVWVLAFPNIAGPK